MRRYRKRRREAKQRQADGMHYVQVALHVTEVDVLVQMGFLKEEDRHDPERLQYRATIWMRTAERRSECEAAAGGDPHDLLAFCGWQARFLRWCDVQPTRLGLWRADDRAACGWD